MRYARDPRLVAGGGALAVAVVVFGVSLGGAFARPAASAPEETASRPGLVEPVSETASVEPASATVEPRQATRPSPNVSAPQAAPTGAALSPEVLELAVDEAPFEASRRAPATRYRLPGDELEAVPEPPELPPAPDFALLGAVTGPDGGFVILRAGDDEPRMLSAGDSFQGYTLASVEADRATMEGLGRRLEVPLQGASPTVEEDEEDDDRRRRFRRSRGDDDEDDDDRARLNEMAEDLAERARRALQEIQGQGGGGRVNVNADGSITVVRPGLTGGAGSGQIVLPRNRAGGTP